MGSLTIDKDLTEKAGLRVNEKVLVLPFIRMVTLKKYTVGLKQSKSEQEVRGVLPQLVQWVASSVLASSERKRLDDELTDRGMLNLEELRVHFLP